VWEHVNKTESKGFYVEPTKDRGGEQEKGDQLKVEKTVEGKPGAKNKGFWGRGP